MQVPRGCGGPPGKARQTECWEKRATSSRKERLPQRGPLPAQAPESRERPRAWARSGLADTAPGRRAPGTDPLAPGPTVPFFLASVRTDIFTGFAG